MLGMRIGPFAAGGYMVQNPKYWRAKELPQVDSLIVLVMTRYIETTKN